MRDRYQIDEEAIGAGGFGKVRRGKDADLERPIALKTLDPIWAAASQADKERFRREARILAKLAHPNIPAIYDVIFPEDDDLESHFHIIFQYIEGENLRALLNEGPLPLQEVRDWFSQAAEALHHAHANGIIHRDIKPENLIVSQDRKHCFLVDFGLALSKEDIQRLLTPARGHIVGTPGYMSPEQEDGQELDTSDDLFVLGVCLYEALCGHRVTIGDYEELNAKDEAIPPAIDELILKCIAPKPGRLKSAEEFRRLLTASVQTHAPMSVILAEGQLHEIIALMRELTPQEFINLPPGQRLVILSKCGDMVASTDHRLDTARAEFMAVLPVLAHMADPSEYAEIVVPAMEHGFGKGELYTYSYRDRNIRDALNRAAAKVGQQNHAVMVRAYLDWMDRSGGVEDREKWYCHALRELVIRLMANTHCSAPDAGKLNAKLSEINRYQRGDNGRAGERPAG